MISFAFLLDRYYIKQPRLRRFITSLFEDNLTHDVSIAGATLRINSRREHGYLRASRMLKHNATLRDEVPVLMNLFAVLRDGDTFVDVGANAGLFTHSVSRLTRMYKNFEVVAIEAHPDTYTRLAALKSDRVTYLNLAMSNKTEKLTFVDGAVSHVFTTIDKQNSYSIPGENLVVQGMRLDELVFRSNSLVIKIDVEGQEMKVLEGASKLLAAGRIKAIYLDGYEDGRINDLLLGYGFSLYEGKTLNPAVGKTFSLLALKINKE